MGLNQGRNLSEYAFSSTRSTIPILVWNGKVVLDYRGEQILDFDIYLTILSNFGKEPARLEAILRPNKKIQWSDILGRIIRRGATKKTISQLQNLLNMSVVRFRIHARQLSASLSR